MTQQPDIREQLAQSVLLNAHSLANDCPPFQGGEECLARLKAILPSLPEDEGIASSPLTLAGPCRLPARQPVPLKLLPD